MKATKSPDGDVALRSPRAPPTRSTTTIASPLRSPRSGMEERPRRARAACCGRRYSSESSRNRSVCCSSRPYALTMRAPARFSCAIVERSPNCSWIFSKRCVDELPEADGHGRKRQQRDQGDQRQPGIDPRHQRDGEERHDDGVHQVHVCGPAVIRTAWMSFVARLMISPVWACGRRRPASSRSRWRKKSLRRSYSTRRLTPLRMLAHPEAGGTAEQGRQPRSRAA